jgi:hypothetical protein
VGFSRSNRRGHVVNKMGKTTKYLLIGGGVLLVAYLLFAKSSTTIKPGSSTTTGWAGIFNGVGNAGKGLGSLWGSIFGSSSSTAPVDTTLDDGSTI